MRSPSFIWLLIAGCLAVAAPIAHGGSTYNSEPYSDNRLEQLQNAGAPVLVKVRTDWCTTCEAQRKALPEALDHPALSELTVLRLDWDDQKAEAEALGAWRQSTLVLFAGDRVIGHSIAETDSGRLRGFVAQAFACE